jgi:hypothetical protein
MLTACDHSTHSGTGDGRQSEDFDLFFKKFNTDPAFQLSRINFPFKLTQVDEYDNKTMEMIPVKQWNHINMLVKQTHKNIIRKHPINKNKINVQFQLEDTGIEVNYCFVNKNDKWWLVSMDDLSD